VNYIYLIHQIGGGWGEKGMLIGALSWAQYILFFLGLMLSYFAFQEPFVNESFSGQSHQSLVM